MILTQNELQIVRYLKTHSPATSEDIALHISFSKSRTYMMLQQLISQNLVAKRNISARHIVYSLQDDSVLQRFIETSIAELHEALINPESPSKTKPVLVISDSYILEDSFISELSEKFQVRIFEKSPRFLSDELFIERCADADIIVNFFSIYISEKLIKKCPHLHTIVLPSISSSSVDVAACKRRGIRVLCLPNNPSYKRVALPEFAISQLLALLRHIPSAVETVTRGHVDFHSFLGEEIRGKKIGIVGTGDHARHVHTLLQAFGAEIYVSDFRSTSTTEPGDFAQSSYYSLEHIFQTCYIALFPEEYKPVIRLDRYLNSHMSTKYLVIGSSEVVYSPEIIKSLLDGHSLKGIAIDYFSEVLHEESDILKSDFKHILGLPNVLITPEIGFYTKESMLRNQQDLMEIVRGL